MADNLCPTCHKPNPDALEICQFCGTPLKKHDTEPLPTIRPGEMPTKQKTSELESTLPGWLRDIRKGDQGENEAPATGSTAPTSQPAKPEAPLDLLAGLSQTNDEEDAVPDWLASLKSDLPPLPTPQSNLPAGGEQNPQPLDWLADLDAGSRPQQAAPQQPAVDWGFDKETQEPAGQNSEETPDWLTALKVQDTSVNAPAQPSAPEPSAADTAFSGGLPDWLDNLGSQPAPSAPTAPADSLFENLSPRPDVAGQAPPSDDLPGWLSDMSQVAAPPAPVEPASTGNRPLAEDLPAAGDFPDWLTSLGSESAAPAQPSQPASPAAPVASEIPASGGDFPDWLTSLGSESTAPAQPSQSAPPAAPVAPEIPASSGDFPDWLTGLGAEPAKTAQAGPPAGFENPPVGDAALPSWMPTTPVEDKPSEKPATPPAKKAFSTGALQELGSLGKADEVPDWLAGLTSAASPPATPPASVSAPAAGEFDWLGAASSPNVTEEKPAGQPEPAVEKPEAAPEAPISSSIPDSGSGQNLDSIFSMEMPDWLSGFTPSEQPQPAAPSQNAFGETVGEQPGPFPSNISPAELPSWVQAMRPIESLISGAESGDEDQTLEKEGPLAGMRSVLPAQANTLGLRKPKAYSIKLQVDPTQMSQATLLENLIASEAESRPVSTPRRVVNIRPLRWVIAAVLLLVVMAPALLGTEFFPTPAVVPDNEIGKFHKLVQELPDAAAVLVVFDYQTGYAGEMEQAAGAVLDHLMAKNARLAFVSGSPTGVLMGERMMAAQNKRRVAEDPESAYKKGTHYIDLGYLPGDAAGIQVFATNPRILGVDYEAGNLWTIESGLGGIQALSDFKAAIVLTDNPDTGRMWIEQTGPALQGKPMLMVVSAQAAPMIGPYYESGQVQGMVAGLAGGAVYEATTQRPGGARDYWDSYGAGMIAAELLIVLGAAWAFIKYLQTRHAEQRQEEDEA